MRDEETGEVWTPTALPDPRRVALRRRARPGLHADSSTRAAGSPSRSHSSFPPTSPIKISRLQIENRSGRSPLAVGHRVRRWLLGSSARPSAPFVVTEVDAETGALFARNPWNDEFAAAPPSPSRRPAAVLDGDRTEFLGRNGGPEAPAALAGRRRCRAAWARAWIPAPRCRRACASRPARNARCSSSSARRATPTEARRLVRGHRSDESGRQLARSCGGAGTTLLGSVAGQDARPLDRPRSSTAGCSTRRCLAASWARTRLLPGRRRVRVPRPAPGRHGSRRRRGRDVAREQILRARLAAVPRRRRPALVAPAFRQGRAHADLRRPALAALRRRATTSTSPATRRSSTKQSPFLEGAPLKPDELERYFEPESLGRERHASSSTAPARSTAASRSARTACR